MAEDNLLDTNKIIDDYLDDAWWVKENSNIDKSNTGLNNTLSRKGNKNYWLTQVYPEYIRKAYGGGLFHIHNLGGLCPYCGGWDIEFLLRNGHYGGPGRQRSGPAKHFMTALHQACNDLYTIQNELDGAVAFNNFDTYMAPFIRKEGLDQEKVNQSIQVFKFHMNVLTRRGGQQTFSNITLDQTPPKYMENEPVIIGGKITGDVYGDFADEMKMFNKAWWKQVIKGDYDGRPQPFPIETLNVTKDFDWDDELLFKAVALRGAPYFSNFVTTGRDPSKGRSMCCHLYIPLDELIKKNGGYFGAGNNTGSIGVVTMNLPLLTYLGKNEDGFFEYLKDTMDIAKDSLEIKRVFLEKLTERGQFPFSRIKLEDTYKRFGEYWKNHFNTIGLIGMHEASLNLLGDGIESNEGLKLGLKTLDFMRNVLLEYQEETGNMYNLEATPGEGASYDLALLIQELYPDIIVSGTKEAPYLTNSTCLPHGLDWTVTQYVEHQEPLQERYTGGTVWHWWGNETVPWWEGISKFMKNILTKTKLPYTTLTPTTSVCPIHGFLPGEHWTCPTCGTECEVWSRPVGYFSMVQRWHDGKRQEFRERHHFTFN